MAAHGPAPKRSDQRRRRNKPDGGDPEKLVDPFEVIIPEADEGWHPVARGWFESLKSSGQSVYYTSSDWSAAFLLAESMSRELHPQQVVTRNGVETVTRPPSAASLAAWLKGMAALMATEGDRRRMSLELQRPTDGGEEAGDVSEFEEYRRRLRESS